MSVLSSLLTIVKSWDWSDFSIASFGLHRNLSSRPTMRSCYDLWLERVVPTELMATKLNEEKDNATSNTTGNHRT